MEGQTRHDLTTCLDQRSKWLEIPVLELKLAQAAERSSGGEHENETSLSSCRFCRHNLVTDDCVLQKWRPRRRETP